MGIDDPGRQSGRCVRRELRPVAKRYHVERPQRYARARLGYHVSQHQAHEHAEQGDEQARKLDLDAIRERRNPLFVIIHKCPPLRAS